MLVSLTLLGQTAHAQDVADATSTVLTNEDAAIVITGQPLEKQLGLQAPASEIQRDVISFHNLLLWIISTIVVVVLLLLLYVMVRFRRSKNPEPSKTAHNTLIEVIWTAIPVIILIVIAIPSFKLLYKMDHVEDPDLVVNVYGYQWYWGYEYKDLGIDEYSSYMLKEGATDDLIEARGEDYVRLLSADSPLVVPVNKTVQIDVTARDVIHSFALPAFGVKRDAIPGRMNTTWFRAEKEGTYFGQCSEICGKDHAFMPIEIRVVSDETFKAWSELAVDDIEAANKTVLGIN